MSTDLPPIADLRRRAEVLLGRAAGACTDVPGVLLGAGPSLTRRLGLLRDPLRQGWAVSVAPASLGTLLGGHRIPIVPLPMLSEVQWSIAALLALRALGCRPIVAAGLDFAFVHGLLCAPGHAIDLVWSSELNPFRTIEDQHLRAVRAVRCEEAMPGSPEAPQARSSAALLAEKVAFERVVALERAAGLRVLQLGGDDRAPGGADEVAAAEALPQRQPVELSRLIARLPATAEQSGAVGSVVRPVGSTARSASISIEVRSPIRVAAVVACDPEFGGTGVPRHLDSDFAGRAVLAATLERLGRVRGIERIILLAPSAFDPRPLFDPRRVDVPVEIEACGRTPFPDEQRVIRIARLWSDTAWRGGINGASVWDEVLAPAATLAAIESRGLDGALLCGADWPVMMVEGLGGAEELVERFRAARGALDLVYAPAPPGLGGCVIGRPLLASLAAREGTVLIGERLDRHPCVDDDPAAAPPVDRIRRSMVRAALDSMRAKLRMRRAIEPVLVDGTSGETLESIGGWAVVEALEHQFFHLPPAFVAQHLIIELNTGRRASGSFSPHRLGSIQRPPMSERILERILEGVEAPRDVVITFGHVGDPLWHPELARFIGLARAAGARAVHVRTELLADASRIDAMLAAEPDVISVDLHANTPASYQAVMGINRLDLALGNLERVLARRGAGDPRLLRPLVVPRMQRRGAVRGELEPFVDAWRMRAGAAVVEGIPLFVEDPEREPDTLLPAESPLESIRREGARRMVILSDGRVPLSELDLNGERTIGSVPRTGVFEVWRDLLARRRQLGRDAATVHPDLRWWQP